MVPTTLMPLILNMTIKVILGRVKAVVRVLHGQVSVYLSERLGLVMKCLQEFSCGLVKDSTSVKISTSWISTT